jgi:hypothetical protein
LWVTLFPHGRGSCLLFLASQNHKHRHAIRGAACLSSLVKETNQMRTVQVRIEPSLHSSRISQVVERRPLDREVRGSNPSYDTMALLLGRYYEFPQCGIITENYSSLCCIAIRKIKSCAVDLKPSY